MQETLVHFLGQEVPLEKPLRVVPSPTGLPSKRGPLILAEVLFLQLQGEGRGFLVRRS